MICNQKSIMNYLKLKYIQNMLTNLLFLNTCSKFDDCNMSQKGWDRGRKKMGKL